jgi:calcium-dependent protein kinase
MGLCGSSSKKIMPKQEYDGTKDHKLEEGRTSSVKTQRLIKESDDVKVEDVYTISGALGSGATSTVRKCTHKVTGDVFALKTLLLNRMTPEMREMLKSEVKIMKVLDHPNIIQLKRVFQEDFKLHIVMECCGGGELFDRLLDNVSPKGRFDEKTTQKYCLEITSALKYLHDNNICHRDLKLENFLLTSKGKDAEIKVIDFGMSRSYLEGEKFVRTVGTIFYMAPEVVDSNIAYTESSDMWSFGVVVYAMLSGSFPFGGFGMSDEDCMKLIEKGTFSMKSTKWENISDDAKDFVASLLIKDPLRRMSATDALKHTFLTKTISSLAIKNNGSGSGSEEGEGEAESLPVHTLRKFRQYSMFKRQVLSVIAFTLGEAEIKSMRQAFKEFDVEKNGVVSFDEFALVMASKGMMENDEIKKLFSSLDQDQTGVIKYSEFLAACVNEKTMLNERRIIDVFSRIDTDHTGNLSKDNLREFLGNDIDDKTFNAVFNDLDLAHDGVVHLSEFRAMLMEKSGNITRKIDF